MEPASDRQRLPQRRCYTPSSSRHHTIQQSLDILGMPRHRYARTKGPGQTTTLGFPGKQGGFWDRLSPHDMETLYYDAEALFKARLKQVRHDFPENHDAAAALIGAWRQFQRLMRIHGVR